MLTWDSLYCGWVGGWDLEEAFILLFCFHSETAGPGHESRIFAGCQLLTSRRVDDWVSTYHSWEQPRCPHDGLQIEGSCIHAPARPVTPRGHRSEGDEQFFEK